ncbi:MBL fold metallo-hydrolase [Marispirochaeta aestuarii]|uniref:MBL fold metallo-hydrolase n=1 Tax=Marispirochaeta aestuarii TaxID=1963862 RepID=UPI002ABDE189|nr:MBL fold metallo-hydrolase [Marispirochaeta aestuarii]
MLRFESLANDKRSGFNIEWIGQAGFIFRLSNGTVICIDPYYSNSIERYEGKACRRLWYNKFIIESFTPDYVLCSHDHLDHTDPETLPLIYAYSKAIFYGPESSIEHMKKMKFSDKRMCLLEADREFLLCDFSIIPKRTRHTEDSVGFLIKHEGYSIYFTGDTALDDSLDFLKDEKIDILIACVNGKYNNMSINDSAQLCRDIGAGVIIPMHYGLITNNTVDVNDIRNIYDHWCLNYFIPKIEKNYKITRSSND